MAKSVLDETIEKAEAELEALKAARKEEARVQRRARLAEEAQKVCDFRDGLFIEHGVEMNPKREEAFAVAWNLGHAYGFSEVANYFSQVVGLIK